MCCISMELIHPRTGPRTLLQRCSTVLDAQRCSCGVAVAVFVQQSVSPGRKCTSTARRQAAAHLISSGVNDGPGRRTTAGYCWRLTPTRAANQKSRKCVDVQVSQLSHNPPVTAVPQNLISGSSNAAVSRAYLWIWSDLRSAGGKPKCGELMDIFLLHVRASRGVGLQWLAEERQISRNELLRSWW